MTNNPYRLFVALLLPLVMLFPMSGCFKAHLDGGIFMSQKIGQRDALPPHQVVGSFDETKRAGWLLLALVPINEPAGLDATWSQDVVQEEISRLGGDAAINVTYDIQWDVLDVLIGLLVGGIYNSQSFTVSGQVVRFD